MKKLYENFRTFRSKQWWLFTLIISRILVNAFSIYYIKYLIDGISQKKPFEYIGYTALIFFSLTVLNIFFQIIQNYKWHYLRYESINHLRTILFRSLVKKPIFFFDKHSTGDLISKVIDDGVIVAQHASIGMPMLFANIIQLSVSYVILALLNFQLSLFILVALPLYYFSFNYLNKNIRKSSGEERTFYSKVIQDCQEKIRGIREIKVTKKENYFVDKFVDIIGQYQVKQRKFLNFSSLSTGLSTIVINLLPVLIILYGGLLVYKNSISFGTLIVFYTMLSNLYEPIMNLSDYNLGLQTTKGMIERVMSFLDDQQSEGMNNEIVIQNQINSVKFTDVSFKYDDTVNVVDSVNLNIKKGDIVSFVGKSGSGKSTLLNLLMKFIKPQQGNITINEADISIINSQELYKYISYMQQNPFIFNGTILENLTLGDAINDEQLKEILEVTDVNNMLNAKNCQLDFLISESGVNLSGGEKQRICLARTLLRNTDIIILDESLNALDKDTETRVIKNLYQYLKKYNKTLIAVTHQPALLSIADFIYQVKNGKLEEIKNKNYFDFIQEECS